MRFFSILTVVSLFTLVIYSCKQNSGHEINSQILQASLQSVTVNEFDSLIVAKDNCQIIDVRTPQEFASGHLKNAININYRGSDFESLLNKLDKNKASFVYCFSGGRSAQAAEQMKEMGFKDIYNMKGGILKWKLSQKPLMQTSVGNSNNGMTMDEFNVLINSDKYILVDFNADWCMPCQRMKPILEDLVNKKKEKLELQQINIDKNEYLSKEKKIDKIPYFELYHKGKLIWKHQGVIDEQTLLLETGL